MAWDAAAATGLNVYTSTFGGKANQNGWVLGDGTSVAAPEWAALIAIVNQGRVLEGGAPLTGYNQTLPGLYSLTQRIFMTSFPLSIHPAQACQLRPAMTSSPAGVRRSPICSCPISWPTTSRASWS